MQLRHALIAETIGTFLLVLFGTGVIAAAVIAGAQVGQWQIAAVWGFGVALAIYATAAISGAHLNPAVSLAFAIFRRSEFPFRRMLAYWTAQLAGATLAALDTALANHHATAGIPKQNLTHEQIYDAITAEANFQKRQAIIQNRMRSKNPDGLDESGDPNARSP